MKERVLCGHSGWIIATRPAKPSALMNTEKQLSASSLLFGPLQRGLLFAMPASATMQANTQSDWTVIRRLLALSWRYRAGCIKVFIYQLIVLAMVWRVGADGSGY